LQKTIFSTRKLDDSIIKFAYLIAKL